MSLIKTMETIKKEERTEWVSVYVTPTIKKEFDLAKDNKTTQELILKRYLSDEKDWLNQELKEIDETTVKYSAKLIGIKEAFSKCQNLYVEEIEQIYKKTQDTFKKLDSTTESTRKSIEYAKSNLSDLFKQINNIDFYKVERLLALFENINSMTEKERELLKKLLNN